MKSTIIILITLATALTARADNHYASHQGSNQYPYTSWATAAHLIQDPVNAASPGDTVFIGSGTYYERIVISTDSLAIIGMGWDSTLVWNNSIDQATFAAVTNIISWIYYEGLHIQNRSGYWCLRGGVYNNLHVNLCKFSNPDDPTIGNGVISAGPPDSAVVENCLFEFIDDAYENFAIANQVIIRNNLFYNVRSQSIAIVGAQKALVNNNIIAHCSSSQPTMGGQDTLLMNNNLFYDCRGAVSIGGTYTSIINNTFALSNINPSYLIFNNSGAPYREIINNNISGGNMITEVWDSTYLWFAYNNIWDVGYEIFVEPGGQLDTTGGNLRCYPMFMGNDDYHLQAYSPLIDAGNPYILDTDGSRSDIGAYGGPGGESYLYIDLPPAIPDSIEYQTGPNRITFYWRMNFEADFNRYLVYRDTIPGFQPSSFNLIGEPDTSHYIDPSFIPGVNNYYRFASVDDQENISDYSEEVAVILTGLGESTGIEIPQFTSITTNYPNPFNSGTVIEYYVANLGPIPAQINIDIYDILGRKVRTLVDGRKEVGNHQVHWDGRDDSGGECPSGVYFAKITQWHVDYLNRYRKIMLLR
jgi:hypothetical protein